MRIRKQDFELTPEDLMEFPVWEYTLDEEGIEGQDERTVRPYLKSSPIYYGETYFIVRATFLLADGSQEIGYIKPINLEATGIFTSVAPVDMSPIVVTDEGRVYFWYGKSKPTADVILKSYRLLKREPSQIFPINFSSDVEILNGITKGTIEGFLYCDDDVDAFHMKTSDIKVLK
jgi:hypothetical protein